MPSSKKPPDRTDSVSFPAIKLGFQGSTSLVPGPRVSVPPPRDSVPAISGLPPAPRDVVPTISGLPPAIPGAEGPKIEIKFSDMPSLTPTANVRPKRPLSKRGIALIAVAVAAVTALVVLRVLSDRSSTAKVSLGPTSNAVPGVFAETIDATQFQRGNIHTHSTRSDGHEPPEEVAAWYRARGYQFLALSEHNIFLDPAELPGVEGPGFVLIPAEEITNKANGLGVHINALCIDRVIPHADYDDPKIALAEGIAGARDAHAVAVVNHPNFQWALSISDIAALSGSYLLEIWSGHPDVPSLGDAVHPSHEALWDELLARGRNVTAVAVDDSHNLVANDPKASLPGRGWIETFGGETSKKAICDALMAGRFFASSGVRFRRIEISGATFKVTVGDPEAVVEFIGNGGRVLATQTVTPSEGGFTASYALHGGETYVRARAKVDGVGTAWTQPYRTTAGP